MIDKEKAELQARRDGVLNQATEDVRQWTLNGYEIKHLILYQQLYAMGVRLMDIPQLIRQELKRMVPK